MCKYIYFSSNELMKTKNKILTEALQQFNTKGVEVVTTRHIASAIKMSQGNLHYHYPNKEAIISGLYSEFLKRISEASHHIDNTVFEKEAVLSSMIDNYKIMHDFRFLFRDNEVIWRRIPPLKIEMLSLLAFKKKEIKEIIATYIDQNIFRNDISTVQIEFLAEQFIFTISTWLNAAAYIETNEDVSLYFAKYTFRLWLPYLTQNEINDWEKLVSNL